MKGKHNKRDVQEFSLNLMDNILSLHDNLIHYTYHHGPYQAFRINDPKPRQIHKSSVRDRLLHHAVYRMLYPFFDRTFISDSFSCRIGKGTHKALNRFRRFAHQESRNDTRTVWVLKCDIRKFFASIDQTILMDILREYIPDKNILWLLNKIIGSFNSGRPLLGLPLGNLTSQLLVNIYMNGFDQFMKHKMKAKYYIRYADDFVIFSHNKNWLEELLPKVADFLSENLRLGLHSDKISTQTISSGVDFLGWAHFYDHRVLRTTTKRRMIKKIKENSKPEVINSYFGLLKHGNTFKLKNVVKSSQC